MNLTPPWDIHCELLKSLPNLQEVRILRDFDDDEDWPEPGEPISLVRLRRLYVNDPPCLDYLRVPSLEEVRIGIVIDRDSAETCRSLDCFLMRSACSPRRLCIHGLLNAQSTSTILQKYPSFTQIVVTDEGEDDEETLSNFLTLFTLPSAFPLPHITEVGFACQNADANLYPLFLDMMDSRRNLEKRPLHVAEFLFLNARLDPDPRSVARIDTLRAEGLHISILSEGVARYRMDQSLFKAWT
ncbi:hypothetical protein MSAN_02016600 [Mycena sanguinolenta]|uniref:Uncharacterized protein n=1 Tax=Mycena sanguinolenta TaxID=230812 RepID=A0A8H6XL20_9AGAR|nr:hypothetical protein MSAN_02016600 [Mycena sanguinolenta]